MTGFNDAAITEAIVDAYYQKLRDCLKNDVVIVGAGPAGMTAAFYLAGQGFNVTIVERQLAPGGGIWGGGMAMNEIVIQEEAVPVLHDAGIRTERKKGSLYLVDAMELASALCIKALHSGVRMLNLTTFEDVCVYDGRVAGVVVNRTGISGAYHVDPITLTARAVLDGTGHDAFVVRILLKRRLIPDFSPDARPVEGPMDAANAERFVVDKVAEVYPGLWVAGMSVSAIFSGPRMGPIFGGMLLSGKRAAEQIAAALNNVK